MQELQIELSNLRSDLNNAITEIKERGKNKAIAEKDYRVELAKEILLLRNSGTPVTIISDICRGKESREMNKEQLSQLKYLKSEIQILKEQILNLDYIITTDSVKGSSPYFPYIERNFLISGLNYQEHDEKLNRLQRKLNRRVEELIDLVDETNNYINTIDDSLVRQILILRYINGLEWKQVAESIGGNNTSESVRKIADRYLK